MRTGNAITSFDGEHRFLSNFYRCSIVMDNHEYQSVEHAYQASKILVDDLRQPFRSYNVTPGDAKRMGRRLPIRTDWEQVKLNIMKRLLLVKFTQSYFLNLLMRTDDLELIEGNTWGDTYWGVYAGRGENHLGKLLMEVRTELRQNS